MCKKKNGNEEKKEKKKNVEYPKDVGVKRVLSGQSRNNVNKNSNSTRL